jgi:hypothetical protein
MVIAIILSDFGMIFTSPNSVKLKNQSYENV